MDERAFLAETEPARNRQRQPERLDDESHWRKETFEVVTAEDDLDFRNSGMESVRCKDVDES